MTQPQIIAASIAAALLMLAFIRRVFQLWRVHIGSIQNLTNAVNVVAHGLADNAAAVREARAPTTQTQEAQP